MKFHSLRIKRHPIAAAVAAALALGGGLVASNGYAQSTTANMSVTASIVNACSIATTTLAFGPYVSGPNNALTDGTATVTTVCTIDAVTTVMLSEGVNPTGTSTPAAPQRQMANGTNRLAYFLYQNTARDQVWGDTSLTGVGGVGTGGQVVLTVYGRIPVGQNKPAGNYADTVVATVTF